MHAPSDAHNRHDIPPPPSTYKGYTLVELAVVLAIVGLVGGLSLAVGKVQMQVAEIRGTQERLETIKQALALFQLKQGRYPCPAAPADATSAATYGVEVSGGCTAACPAGLTCGANAVIGFVPFKTLGLNDETARDAWDDRITYAIDKNHTAASTYGLGTLHVQDMNGNKITASSVLGEAIYVLVSHGRDTKGAYNRAGVRNVTCTAGYLDTRNCDGDDIFLDAKITDSAANANFNDDLIAWETQENVNTATAATTGIVSLDLSDSHICVAKQDGTAWCKGANENGQLGDGTSTDSPNSFVQVAGVTNVTQVSLVDHSTLLLQSDGKLYCNGDSGLGACDWNGGPWTDGLVMSGVTQLGNWAYGRRCALKNDGTVWCWGSNPNGELGNNTTTDSATPVQVSGLAGVVSIAGSEHVCAVKGDGTVWCWGDNQYGQLGDNTTTDRHVPVQALGLTGATKIAVTWDNTCALKSDGTVWCWGYNAYHEHATGDTTKHKTPVQSSLTNVRQLEGGGYNFFCAVKNDDTVWCWGNNQEGETGESGGWAGGVTDPPVQVLSGVKQVASGSTGDRDACALKNDGTVWCWGANMFTGTSSEVPWQFTPLP